MRCVICDKEKPGVEVPGWYTLKPANDDGPIPGKEDVPLCPLCVGLIWSMYNQEPTPIEFYKVCPKCGDKYGGQ